VFDADAIAKKMWFLPEVRQKAEARWGAGFLDGSSKEALGRIAEKIFTDDEEYEFAAALIHGPVMAEMKRMIDCSGSAWVVAEVPLLYEYGVPRWIDGVVYASAPFEKRVERNKNRGWDSDEILRRERRLLPSAKKMMLADWVLENSGTEDEWRAKARALGQFFIKISGKF